MNPYLNTPPTELRRMLESEQDPGEERLMREALEAWRKAVPGPFRRAAGEIMRVAAQVAHPEWNVLMTDRGDDDLLVVLAENVPQSSDEETTYSVAAYRIDKPNLEPDTYFWRIPTLERARVVYEEVLRTF